MKIVVIICFLLLLLSALIQFLYYRRNKAEFSEFYQNYVGNKLLVPPFVVFADNLGFIGVSLKAQWFLWLLNNRKIKIGRNTYLDSKAYEFVQTTASKKLQRWIRNDFRLLMLQGAILILMCILIYFINNTKS
ncbi:hypothetical protein E5C26_02810 [Serratia proteamaculans]|uniref:hypothetical protein n=1 Tax=Serratia proteamaculans TaxID=28151 RepID=UPI001076596D|nr:hypothetical protein [Serratia proteamaculans]TFZ53274.1 hypothetical protein E5C26_02810 [Serratia proteamaculans]